VSQVHPAGQLSPQSISPLQPSPILPQYDPAAVVQAVALLSGTQASPGPPSGILRITPPLPPWPLDPACPPALPSQSLFDALTFPERQAPTVSRHAQRQIVDADFMSPSMANASAHECPPAQGFSESRIVHEVCREKSHRRKQISEQIENTMISPECRISLDFLWGELALAREAQPAAH
jgi:hypothetical protein